MPVSITPNNIIPFFESLIGKNKRFTSRAEMARFLGLGDERRMTLDRFLKGTSTQYEYVMEWFLKLGGQMIPPDEKMTGFELIPRVKAVAGAGESFVIDDDVAGMYAFRREFLDRIGVRAKDAVMMYVSGDSMTPLICDRDTVLFDSKDTEAKDGYIYVCSFGDALMVKRLQIIPGGWQLCSENPRYSPTPIQGVELQNFRIHGRVRWFGRVI